MKKPLASLWRLGLAAVVSIVLLIMIATVIQQLPDISTRTYNAAFTDVSGLHEGSDVRVRGVQVGKVEALELKRSDGRSIAAVRFTLDKRFSIGPDSRLAIRFQALTGLRYIDVASPIEGDTEANRITDVPTSMTRPSFDVTVLFNGLQPVLAALSPDDINTFTDNVTAFLAGDGSGLGPMLDSIRNLTALVSNREQVIETIVRNLSVLADGVSGRSRYLPQVLQELRVPVSGAMTVLDEFRKSFLYGPEFTASVIRMFDAAGIKPGIDISTALDKAFTNVYDNIDVLKRIPVVWENIQPPPVVGTPAPCSNGRAVLPLPMDVLLNGRKVVLCNRS
jgi:phospholipid/cholesterol/gamma-HCH transport system substrate-binding protein